MRKTILLTLALTSAVAVAQGPGPKAPTTEDLLITQAQMNAILSKAVSKDTGKPAGISSRLINGGTYSTALIRLIAPDHPHAHGQWSEIYIVKEGEGTMETGGALVCPCSGDSATHHHIFANQQAGPPAPSKPGTPHDGSSNAIAGGRMQKVKAGDIVLVPQGVPHVWTAIDKPVVYLDIKFH